MKKLITIFIAVILAASCSKKSVSTSALAEDDDHGGHAAGGELKTGKYYGFVTLDRTKQKIPTVVDFYIVQPEDITEFPKLNVSIRMSFGGYNGREYITEVTEDIHYDYDNGSMSIDSTDNDLVISAEVHNMQNIFIFGDVWIQSAAESGKLKVQFLSDEPGGGDEPGGDDGMDGHGGHSNGTGDSDEPGSDDDDDTSIMSELSGQFVGRCDNKKAALQIRTVRGLGGVEDTKGLVKYGISTTLAYDDPTMCGTGSGDDIPAGPTWCSIRTFNEGSYNPFSGNLILKRELGTENCRIEKNTANCKFRMLDHTTECSFERSGPSEAGIQIFERSFSLRTTPGQREALPPPSPPRNLELISALKGQFSGYLHHELTNKYQAVRLNIVATTSTDNPHNENAVYVTPTLVMHFGPGLSQEFWVNRYNRNLFNLAPGFSLESDSSDAFIQIEDWRKGYIKAGFYSHSFGRVGSIQLVKDSLPAAPAGTQFVPSIAGEFEGPVNRSPGTNRNWWFKSIVASQPSGRDAGVLEFSGEARFRNGIIRPLKIEKGAYDIFTGNLGWKTAEVEGSRIVIGHLDGPGNIALLWPGSSKFGVGMWDYIFYNYDRQN